MISTGHQAKQIKQVSFTKNHSAAHHKALRPICLAPDSTDKQLSIQGCIKVLQSGLAKPVTHQIHTKLSLVPVVPVSSKPVSFKQLIQTVKRSRPNRISKPIVQVQQRPLESPTAIPATPSPFKSLELLAPLYTRLQEHHIKWIHAPIYCYKKQLQTAI